MRLIDADALLERIVELEKEALEHVANDEPSIPLERWHMWNTKLNERTLFKYDLVDAPTITIEEYAKAEGCSIIKRKPMPKLRPCPTCGATGRKIEEWTGRYGYFYICSECHHQSRPARSVRHARENWNEENEDD